MQELGLPNPIPNELILIFSGYVTSIGKLDFTLVFMTVVAADVIGTTIVYLVFYNFGQRLMKRVRFLPNKKINQLVTYLSCRGRFGIYLGRLLPLVRGYASVAAGLLRLPPKEFIPAVILSAITWSGGYVLLGKIIGPTWSNMSSYFGFKQSLLVVVIVIILYLLVVRLYDMIQARK